MPGMTTASGELHRIEIDGVTYTWDRGRDLMLMNGMPVAALLLESSLAGMMWGIERMVGLERFQLAMQAAGRRSVAEEWDNFISQMPTPEQGIGILGSLTLGVDLKGLTSHATLEGALQEALRGMSKR